MGVESSVGAAAAYMLPVREKLCYASGPKCSDEWIVSFKIFNTWQITLI